MGLFGIAIGKKATARKADQKLKKIEARQAGKTARVELRQDAKVEKATVKADADKVAYANGLLPPDPLASVTGMVGEGIKGLASFFGGGTSQTDYSGVESSQGGQVYNSPGVGNSAESVGLNDFMGSSVGGMSPLLLIGGGLLLLMMLNKK